MGRSTSIPSAEDLSQLTKPVSDSRATNGCRSYRVYARDGKMIHEEAGNRRRLAIVIFLGQPMILRSPWAPAIWGRVIWYPKETRSLSRQFRTTNEHSRLGFITGL